MLPKNVSEVEVSELFSQYGTINELQILRGSQQTSKGTDLIAPNSYLVEFCNLETRARFLENLTAFFNYLNYGRLCFSEV